MMGRCKKSIVWLGAILVLTLVIVPTHSGVRRAKRFKLPSAEEAHLGAEMGSWDYFDVEPGTRPRSSFRADRIFWWWTSEGKQVADIPGRKGAHAIVFAPETPAAS